MITPQDEDWRSSNPRLNSAPNSPTSILEEVEEVSNPSLDVSRNSLDTIDSFQEQFDSFTTFDSDVQSIQSSEGLEHEEDNVPVWYDLTQNINDLDDYQDVIPLEDSERRLNSLCLVLAFILMISSSIFIGICFNLFKPPLLVYMNHSETRQLPRVPHLMILLSDGSMTPYSWKPHQTSKVRFPQLVDQRSEETNFGLESYHDNLYAFSLAKFNGFTSITPNGTHRLIMKPMFNQSMDNKVEGRSVVVNNFIWILEGFSCPKKNPKIDLDSVIYAAILGLMPTQEEHLWGKNCKNISETMLWSVPRQNWLQGSPKLPNSFDLKYGCVTAYNRSTVVLIGGLFNHQSNRDGFVYAYDFDKYQWYHWYERIPLDPTFGYYQRYHISCTVHHKKEQSVILAMTSPNGMFTSISQRKYVTLWNFEVQSNQWTKILVQNMKSKGKVAILQGIIHYFPYGPIDPYDSNDKDSLGFYFEPKNKTFIPLVQEGIKSNSSINLYATPCYLQI